MMIRLLTLLAVLLPGAFTLPPKADPLIVQLANGRVRGKDNGNYYSWEALPYAEAPVGTLRFEAPQPYRRIWNGTVDATVPYDVCMQWSQFGDKLLGVEDCLTVNVYKPKTNGCKKLPVMVFIHGGCFMFGGDEFDGDYLWESGKIMLVKIIYRLGPLGFLSTEDEAIAGNFGLKDQQLALRWIKKNIDRFGGDSSKIMVTGFSAGGASTQYHMLQPSMANIAKVTVSFSGVSLNPWALVKNAHDNALKMGKLMNCPELSNTQELKHCLQQKDAKDIVSAVKAFHNIGYNPFTVFGPVIEHQNVANAFLTQHPIDIIKAGKTTRIPWLVAYTKEDGGYNAAELLSINPQTGKEFIYELNDRWLELAPQNLFLRNFHDDPVQYAQDLRVKYMGNLTFSVDSYWELQKMYTDVLFRNGALLAMKLHREYFKSPVYGYVYDNPADYAVGYVLSNRKDYHFGTNHVGDMSLILKISSRSPMRPDEEIISRNFIDMLIGFVETGKPTFGKCKLPKNSGKGTDALKLLLITKDNCQTISEKV